MYLPKAKGFMNKSWDGFVPPPGFWKEVLRVLKPGAYGLVFASSRTQDLMGLSLRIAGFEIRDCVTWLYGSGFPKSHDISKAMDKKNGTLKVIGQGRAGKNALGQDSGYNKTYNPNTYDIVEANSEEAKQWEGWGTALKPSYEPALLIRKPFKGSVASNVLEWGVGGINIDGCRIEGQSEISDIDTTAGRWPSNIMHDGSEQIQEIFPKTVSTEVSRQRTHKGIWSENKDDDGDYMPAYGDHGNASRYFYCAKTSKDERKSGLGGKIKANTHPTVKPVELMRYLVRLVTPKGGLVLDPFMGSGSTGMAAREEDFQFVGIERELEYYEIAKARIKNVKPQLNLFDI